MKILLTNILKMPSITSNTLQINYDDVYLLLDDNMVDMFKSMKASGLKGLLGCTSYIYEKCLSQFFVSAKTVDGEVVCIIDYQSYSISQALFLETFGMLAERVAEFNRLTSVIYEEMKIKFSFSGLSLKFLGKHKKMKVEYRLLNDIVAKPLTTKGGSFDTFIVERLEMMIVISVDIKINWSTILFNILVAMISTPDKQHQGYDVQICYLLH